MFQCLIRRDVDSSLKIAGVLQVVKRFQCLIRRDVDSSQSNDGVLAFPKRFQCLIRRDVDSSSEYPDRRPYRCGFNASFGVMLIQADGDRRLVAPIAVSMPHSA